MAAAVAVERAGQPMRHKHIEQAAKRRGGSFLLDQDAEAKNRTTRVLPNQDNSCATDIVSQTGCRFVLETL
jgi:hypothetical protein